jgi:hypothetical protein
MFQGVKRAAGGGTVARLGAVASSFDAKAVTIEEAAKVRTPPDWGDRGCEG